MKKTILVAGVAAAGLVAVTGCGGATASTLSASRGAEPITLVPAPAYPSSLFATDLRADDAFVYWASNTGDVWKVEVATKTQTQIATTGDENQMPTIQVAGADLYVLNGYKLYRGTTAGGALTTLATSSGPTYALTLHGSTLYWTNAWTDPRLANDAQIDSMTTAGGAVRVVAKGLESPSALAADDAHVYFNDLGAGTVNAVALDTGHVAQLAAGQAGLGGIEVAGDRVIWSNFKGQIGAPVGHPVPPAQYGDGSIDSAPIAGGASTVVASSYGTSSPAVDGGYVYWSDGVKKTIVRTPLAGGKDEIVVEGDAAMLGPIVGAQAIFYESYDGSIKMVSKP